MGIFAMLLTAVGLSMDAFAVAVCEGLTMPRVTLKKQLVIGVYFGAFQAGMPVLGYLLGAQFADKIAAYDHWVAFALLAVIGARMAAGSFKRDSSDGKDELAPEASLSPGKMLPLAFATSVDALAIGISFAFLGVAIVPAASFIGIVTLLLSMLGVRIGNAFGLRFKSKAELLGGVILIALGIRILFEHLGAAGF